jgi:peptide/nickel transport system substrate-binding protein
MLAGGSASCAPLYMENWINPPGNYNLANLNDPWVTNAFRTAQTVVDKEERIPLMKEISLYFLDIAPYIVLPNPHLSIYWWPWLKNYYGEVDLAYFDEGIISARVWLDEDLKKEMGY